MQCRSTVNRRQFLEGSLACGALMGAGGADRTSRLNTRESRKPARSAISRSRWPNGRCTRLSSATRSTTSTSPRSPEKNTESKASSSSTSSSRTRPRIQPT